MHFLITSTQNPKIKSLLSLEKARERRKQCLAIVEGRKEISIALSSDYKIGNLFFCEELIAAEDVRNLGIPERNLIPVSREVWERLAVREGSGGVIAVAEQKSHHLDALTLGKVPLVLILESVEKPGNLGAMLRTADAANLDAVIICDPQTDLYNPNVIRSSLGCVFTNSIAIASSEKTIEWLHKKGIKIYCTYLASAKPYYEADFATACAIVMGTESTGLSDLWIKHAHAHIVIPMEGKIDSMNVSNAAAVVVFEAKRQRKIDWKI